jgi:hypothetical protein
MTSWRTLTVIAPIRKGCEDSVRAAVNAVGDSLQTNGASTALHRIETIHFARWVIVDGLQRAGGDVPARLVFCSNYDGPVQAQLADLAKEAGPLLDRMYAQCEGYPADAQRTDEARARYLEQHIVGNDGIFIGAPDRTLTQIRQENALRIALQKRLDGLDTRDKTAGDVVQALREHVKTDEQLGWAQSPAPPREVTWLRMAIFVLVALPLVPLAVLWLLLLRLLCERTDQPRNLKVCELDRRLVTELEVREDISVQSPFTQLMDIKPGRFRLLTLKGLLWTASFLGRNFFTSGNIMFIPSIHFYTWIMLPEGRLLFLSNFDGSWQSYLGDFIDKAGFGLNGILSNCSGFPRTWFLFFKGVKDVDHYKAWARAANVPTQAFYTAYPTLSVKNVNDNSITRRGLWSGMNERQAAAWLRRL